MVRKKRYSLLYQMNGCLAYVLNSVRTNNDRVACSCEVQLEQLCNS